MVAARRREEAAATDFAAWNWEDPQRLTGEMERFLDGLARCEKLEPTGITPPYTRQQLVEIGVTGIEFAAFKTAHRTGLGTDIVSLRTNESETGRGRLYVVDGERYFVELDVAETLPFESGCVEWVYAEHLIEHIPVPMAIGWLTEVRRVLAPGGLLRLTTPDLRAYVESYLDGGRFFANHRRRIRAIGLGPPMPARDAFMFNQLFYLYGHQWIYDLAELRYVLAEAGFDPSGVHRRDFREGARQDVASLDRVLRKGETIYVEVTA